MKDLLKLSLLIIIIITTACGDTYNTTSDDLIVRGFYDSPDQLTRWGLSNFSTTGAVPVNFFYRASTATDFSWCEYSVAFTGDIVQGSYEVIIDRCGFDAHPTGTYTFDGTSFTICDDVVGCLTYERIS